MPKGPVQKLAGKLVFSPSDLIKFMESEFITWMDRFDIEHPGVFERDPDSETNKILQARGIAHEAQFLYELRGDGREIVDLSGANDKFAATIDVMKKGADIIYQGALKDEEFVGYADFLEKVAGESKLGNYHYEPWDTKLVHVVLGDKQLRSFRTDDYIYYYRQLRRALVEQQANFDEDAPPELIGLEDFGRWNTHVEKLLENKDHLCRVANIRAVQIKRLLGSGINTMTDLAKSPLVWIPRMQEGTFDTLKQQARLQLESKGLTRPKFEVIWADDASAVIVIGRLF